MNYLNNVFVNNLTQRRFFAALKWCGETPSNTIQDEVNRLINRYIEESGAPMSVSGEPIEGIVKTVEFVYDKGGIAPPKWRTVYVIEDGKSYIKGYENGQFKCFSKSKIVGGRILEVE